MNNNINTSNVSQNSVPGTQPQSTPQPIPIPNQVYQQPVPPAVTPPQKKKSKLPLFLIIVILGLIGYIIYSQQDFQKKLNLKELECTPVSTNGESKNLDLNSTIVQDLYNKVATNIREDLASTNLDDSMKRYLAYRQIATDKIYDSNCNLYSTTNMEPFVCEESLAFTPTAFKEETLQIEIKKLFGEKTNIPNENIQLNTSCIGGYQYIAERGEYVQGYCKEVPAALYRASKELIKATSTKSSIVLKEKVKYYGGQGLELPSNLKSGTYVYTFRLDTNYNYVYISKTFEQ